MSLHRVDVIRINELERHPNADTLSVVRIFGRYTCVVRTDDWKVGDLGAYLEPDMVVDSTRPEFAFLAGHERLRVKKLRGIVSMGLLVKAPPGTNEGDDVMEALGVRRYEPPMSNAGMSTGGEAERPPDGVYAPNYDVENWRRYSGLIRPDEVVVPVEKLHGASSKYVWAHGRLWASSRTEWKREDAGNIWWKCVAQNPWIAEWCAANAGMVLYGEVFGSVQDLRYGARPGELRFRAFDVMRGNEWLGYDDLRAALDGMLAPMVAMPAPHGDGAWLEAAAEGRSLIEGAEHVREGVVVRPIHERTCPEIGRVQLKIVSSAYLERAK